MDAGEAAFIDTGSTHAVPLLLAALAQVGLEPEQVRYLLPTHAHLDHAGGTGALLAQLPQATVVAHARAAPHLLNPSKLWASACTVYGETQLLAQYGSLHPVPPARLQIAGDSLALGQRTLHLLDTPGHARHHYCVYDPSSAGVFTGDTFGLAYPQCANAANLPLILPSSTPTQFDPEAWQQSLRRIHDLAPKRLYVTHYGAWPYSANLREQLSGQLDAYVKLATTNPEGAIAGGIRALTAAALAQHGSDVAAGLAWLAEDIELNAQGLVYWQRRQR